MKKVLTVFSLAAFVMLILGGGIILVNLMNSQSTAPLETSAANNVVLSLTQVEPQPISPTVSPIRPGALVVVGVNANNVATLATDVQLASITLKFDPKVLAAKNVTAGKGLVMSTNKIDNLAGTITFALSPAATPPTPSSRPLTVTPSPLPNVGLECGVNIDPINPKGDPAPADLNGINWVRLVYKESQGVAYYKTKIDAYPANTKVLLILNHESYWGDGVNNWNLGNFAGYAQSFTNKAGGILDQLGSKVAAVEIWNEPDGVGAAFAHLTPQQLGMLASVAYPTIKAKGKQVVVGGFQGGEGSVASYIDGMGQIAKTVDAISVHPYTKVANTPAFSNYLNTILAKVSKVWITEYSWNGTGVDPDKYVKDFSAYLKQNYATKIPVAMLYAWSDGMQTDQGLFGLLDINLTKKQPLFDDFVSNCATGTGGVQANPSQTTPSVTQILKAYQLAYVTFSSKVAAIPVSLVTMISDLTSRNTKVSSTPVNLYLQFACSNQRCDVGETNQTCPADCKAPPPTTSPITSNVTPSTATPTPQPTKISNGIYTNICGCGFSANCSACSGCDTGSRTCGGGAWAVSWTCNGKVTSCTSNEQANVRTINTSLCGVTQQLDVFNHNCRASGGWSCGDTDLVSYLVYYTGDCPGGPTATPTH